jgi:uncharacterized protein with PIN domain
VTEIVIDTSAIVAVITDAPEKGGLIRITEGAALVAPRFTSRSPFGSST